ncbi:hypothetical protein C6A85_62505, partial [Mycobacterium sp. ITM-2017-0098]
AIDACLRAMTIRRSTGSPVAVSADHHSLAVYEWYSGNRAVADMPVGDAIEVLDGDAAQHDPNRLCQLGHGFAMQAFLAVQSSRADI